MCPYFRRYEKRDSTIIEVSSFQRIGLEKVPLYKRYTHKGIPLCPFYRKFHVD